MQNRWENKDDMKRMQQDAIRRVQEMQSKAQEKISQTTITMERENKKDEEPVVSKKEKPKMKLKKDFIGKDLIKTLTQDSEKNLILMLLVLLMEEETDTELLISLMYLLI